jgi:hypothetical protein
MSTSHALASPRYVVTSYLALDYRPVRPPESTVEWKV